MKRLDVKIESVRSFLFYHEGIIYLTGSIRSSDRNVCYWSKQGSKLLVENGVIPTLREENGYILLYFPDKSIIIKREFELVEIRDFSVDIFFPNNDFVGYKRENDGHTFRCYYSMKEKSIKWKIYDKLLYPMLIDELLIYWKITDKEVYIAAISLAFGSELWQFSLSSLPPYEVYGEQHPSELSHIIGLYNNLLWVDIGGWRLIAIDIITGELIHQMDPLPVLLGMEREERSYFTYSRIHLDKENGLLKILANRYYVEFNLNSLKATLKKDFGAKWSESWSITRCTFYQSEPSKLFFCGHYKSIAMTPNAFGIFDIEKAEIIWFETQKGDAGFIEPPQVNDKILAVRDSNSNLLIYDRDESDI
jgi:predicted Rdx family selenoprotein